MKRGELESVFSFPLNVLLCFVFFRAAFFIVLVYAEI
jgi:hypothetical protein